MYHTPNKERGIFFTKGRNKIFWLTFVSSLRVLPFFSALRSYEPESLEVSQEVKDSNFKVTKAYVLDKLIDLFGYDYN